MNEETGAVSEETRRLLGEIVADERKTEERIRKASLVAWAAAFAAVPLFGLVMYFTRNVGGSSVEVGRALLVVVTLTGGLALFLAVLMTLAWLFRSRAPTLAVIERRLAVLEEILLSRGGPR